MKILENKCTFIGAIKAHRPDYGGSFMVKEFYRPMLYDDDQQYFQAPDYFAIRYPDGKVLIFELRPQGMTYTYFNPAIHTREEIGEFLRGTTRCVQIGSYVTYI